MDQISGSGQGQTCPKCDHHCPADALQCGRGHAYFSGTNANDNHDHRARHHRGRGDEGHHGHGCGRRHERGVEWGDLAEKFERCGRLISHCLGKRRGQGRILSTLCQRGEMPQKELQELLGIQAGSMSEIATKLEDKGFIVRVRSEEDRRKVSLSITEKGRERAAQSNKEHIRLRRAELFSALSAEEQQTLETLLDKLAADWAQRLEQQPHDPQSEPNSP